MTRIVLTVDKSELEAFNKQFDEFLERSKELRNEFERLDQENAKRIENIKRLQRKIHRGHSH